jgi:hypothetical protein
MGIPASGPFLGAYASNFTPDASSSRAPPPSPMAPSTSRGRKASKSKQGKLSFIAQGIFACFNMCRQNAYEMREHRRYIDEELLKIERRQKELMAKVDIPHSPVREPRDFSSPPPIYNPLDDYVPQEYQFGDDFELDYGGQEMPFQGGQANSDEEEEEEGGDDETESECADEQLPFWCHRRHSIYLNLCLIELYLWTCKNYVLVSCLVIVNFVNLFDNL